MQRLMMMLKVCRVSSSYNYLKKDDVHVHLKKDCARIFIVLHYQDKFIVIGDVSFIIWLLGLCK